MVYLLLIITLAIALTVEQIIAHQRKSARAFSVSDIPVFNKSSIYAPQGYLISKYHTWVHPEEKVVKVGIDKLAEDLKSNPDLKVQITAHTDNVGSNKFSMDLSVKRAQSVKEYLVQKGCNPENIQTFGKGKNEPLNENLTEDERAKNRRFEFAFINQNKEPEEKAVKVGIDNFAVKTLGNIFIKNILNTGNTVKKGDTIITAEVHGQQINFKSPVTGTVKAINKLLFNNKIKDAYGKDWGLLIEKNDRGESLMSGSQAQHWLKNELKRLKDFLAESSFTPEAVGVTMYDGGNIVEGVLSSLSPKTIHDFEKQFLSGNNA